MRVFLAIDLPSHVRENLAAIQQELRSVSSSARWVDSGSAHLTLKFLGEITEQRVEEVHHAMKGLVWKPFMVTVKGLGFFPGARSPRVLWAGLHAPTLESLVEKIDSRLEQFGFEKEMRTFRAHITIARAKHGPLEPALANAATKFEEHDFGVFNVNRCFLYQSQLLPTGPVYTRLQEYLLS